MNNIIKIKECFLAYVDLIIIQFDRQHYILIIYLVITEKSTKLIMRLFNCSNVMSPKDYYYLVFIRFITGVLKSHPIVKILINLWCSHSKGIGVIIRKFYQLYAAYFCVNKVGIKF